MPNQEQMEWEKENNQALRQMLEPKEEEETPDHPPEPVEPVTSVKARLEEQELEEVKKARPEKKALQLVLEKRASELGDGEGPKDRVTLPLESNAVLPVCICCRSKLKSHNSKHGIIINIEPSRENGWTKEDIVNKETLYYECGHLMEFYWKGDKADRMNAYLEALTTAPKQPCKKAHETLAKLALGQ